MPDSGFGERLAYVRWLRIGPDGERETDEQFAAALGVGVKWLGKWKYSEPPPKGLVEAQAIEKALRGMGVTLDWLYGGTGPPPSPRKWADWLKSHRAIQTPYRGQGVKGKTRGKRTG